MARHPLTHEQLVAGVLAGDHRAIARAISLVENGDPAGAALVSVAVTASAAAPKCNANSPPAPIDGLTRHAHVTSSALPRSYCTASPGYVAPLATAG